MCCIPASAICKRIFSLDMTDYLLFDKNWTNFSVCVQSRPLLTGKQCQREPSSMSFQSQIQDFPEGFANPKGGGANLLFGQMFIKSAWKWRKLDLFISIYFYFFKLKKKFILHFLKFSLVKKKWAPLFLTVVLSYIFQCWAEAACLPGKGITSEI